MTIDRERAIIAHFPIGAAINCAIGDVDWTYIEVELAVGFEMGQAVADLAASVAYKDAFSQPITAPAEWVATPMAPTLTNENFTTVDAIVAPTAPTFEEAKAIANGMSGGERSRIRGAMVGSVPSNEAAFIAAVMHIAAFHDVAAERPPAPLRPLVEASTLPTAPDEGDDVTDAAVEELKLRYAALDPAARSWVEGIVGEAKRRNLDMRLRDHPTSRRWHLLAGLVTLADGYDNDDAVRGILAPIIGAELADSKSFSLGQLVGCCSAPDASRFRDVAVCLAEGSASMVFTDAGACRVQVAA